MRSTRPVLFALIAFAAPLIAQAATTAVPEIDPSGALSAITLVAGTLAVMGGRSRRK
jgi:hypothetical protein